MGTTAIRVLVVAAAAVASVTCSDTSTGLRRTGRTALALAPAFAQGASGGPAITISLVRGVLRNSTDSSVAEAGVEGDTAVLEFADVPVTGDSTMYQLTVQAFDPANVLVFEVQQSVVVKTDGNEPVEPNLTYVAPDAEAADIDVGDAFTLDWAGAMAGDLTCLNRSPKVDAVVTRQLAVTGQTSGGQAVSGVRVGWTSRDTTTATVDENGLVRARCANRSTWIVARTFLDVADSVLVTVTAPPFALMMSPDSTSVGRGATVQLSAVLVDEDGNAVPATTVTWSSSNAALATVSSTGVVTGVANGRVLITAASEGRTTVAVVQVIRPAAAAVVAIPQEDSMAVGSTQTFYAKAQDASGRFLGDAAGFSWMSTNPAVATVGAATGVVKAIAVGDAGIIAMLDGKKDTVALTVKETLTGGKIRGRLLDASTEQPLEGVQIQSQNGTALLTDGNGEFYIGGIQPGDSLSVSKPGYVSFVFYDAPVFRGHTLELPDAGIPAADAMSGTLAGKVLNALSGSPISGVTVTAYKGLNAAPSARRPAAVAVGTATTSSLGQYSLTLGSGVYTLRFSAAGYSENITFGSVVGNTTETLSNVLLPPAGAGAGLVVVLTWSPNAPGVPADLDAHVTGPDGASRFHVYTGNRSFVSIGDTIAKLEVDDVSYSGPEVVTVRSSAPPGTYAFYVHNYSGRLTSSTALSDSSEARVDVYQDNRVIGTFFPPPGQPGTLWKVFEFDGARLFPDNTISHQSDATTLPRIVGDPGATEISRIFSAIQAIRKGR